MKSGKTEEKEDRYYQRELQQRGSDVWQAAECVKDRKQWKNSTVQPHHQQLMSEHQWVKEEKEYRVKLIM